MTNPDRPHHGETLAAFNAMLEATGLGRKGQADLVGEESEAAFRKAVNGHQAAPLDYLDALPDVLLLEFLRRLGERRGFTVEPRNLDAEVLAVVTTAQRAIAQLVHLQRLREVQLRTAKADLPIEVRERRRA